MFALVEYLHIAFSFVDNENIVDIVPDANVFVGEAFESTGGLLLKLAVTVQSDVTAPVVNVSPDNDPPQPATLLIE